MVTKCGFRTKEINLLQQDLDPRIPEGATACGDEISQGWGDNR